MSGETIVIEAGPGEIRGALLRGGAVWEVDHHRAAAPRRVGAVYRGRVRKVDPGLNGAFVDIGIGQDGFLRARDAAPGGDEPGGKRRNAQVAKLLHEGQRLVVRVVSDAFADKGPRLAAAEGDAPADRPGDVACLVPPPTPVVQILERFVGPDTDAIVCGDGAVARAARAWAELAAPALAGRIEREAGSPFRVHGVDEAIERALARRVALAGGAELVFDLAESLCAIDVDSAAQGGKASRAARDVNLKAMPEIARELRLRNIAGAIVIDALRMGARDDRNRVLDALRRATKDDPSTCHVLGVSALGLIEMTRTRTGPTLAERLCEPAAGPRPRADAVAYAALRAALREGAGGRAPGASLRVAGEVAALLDGPLRAARDEAAALLGRLDIVREDAWPRARFEVVLGFAPGGPGKRAAQRGGAGR